MPQIFNFVTNLLKKVEGFESVDLHFGRTNVDDANLKARLIGEQKALTDPNYKNLKTETSLVKYEFSGKLIWHIYFLHTQDDWKIISKKETWMRFALVKIDDKTGEILFADFIKPQIVD